MIPNTTIHYVKMVPNDDVSPSVINFFLYKEDTNTNKKSLDIH